MFKKVVVFLIIFSLGASFGGYYLTTLQKNKIKLQAEKNTPAAFVSEVYDKVLENYWDNLSASQLLELFKLSLEKNGASVQIAKIENKNKLLNIISDSTQGMNEEKSNQFIAQVAGTVLTSLNPPGRSGLFTKKLEEQLKNKVENVNPEKNLYSDLGVSKDDSQTVIQQVYQKKFDELANDKSATAQAKLKDLSYAKDVLSKNDTKERYDQNRVEPTIFTKIIRPGILYIQFKKFSPTSYDEFIKAFESYKDDKTLTILIFDLRGNIGGAIDSTAYFLGNFIGKNQYAFDFYHKGEYLPFKTQTEKLPSVSKYKQVVILIDGNTQSSAEMMAAGLKKYHVGITLGTPTKGWGTVEKVFPIDNQFDKSQNYSIFLVHSITLRDDNLPIEGRGIEPDINIKNPDWQQTLFFYFRNQQLTDAVKSLY